MEILYDLRDIGGPVNNVGMLASGEPSGKSGHDA
jgi:hypothetical protein